MQEKTFYLTFDGAVNPPGTLRILDTLSRYDIHATFFVEGHRIAGQEQILHDIISAGHHIGNHSFTHPDFSTLAPDDCMKEVAKTDKALFDATGLHTGLLRPPCGILPDDKRKMLEDAGYQICLWSISVKDWLGPNASSVAERTLSLTQEREVTAVYHDHVEWTPETVALILPKLQDRGYRIRPIPYAP